MPKTGEGGYDQNHVSRHKVFDRLRRAVGDGDEAVNGERQAEGEGEPPVAPEGEKQAERKNDAQALARLMQEKVKLDRALALP